MIHDLGIMARQDAGNPISFNILLRLRHNPISSATANLQQAGWHCFVGKKWGKCHLDIYGWWLKSG